MSNCSVITAHKRFTISPAKINIVMLQDNQWKSF